MKTTNDLLDVLSNKVDNTKDLDRYIDKLDKYNSDDFVKFFAESMSKHKIKKSELVKKSGIDRTYFYQILNGTRKPGRDNALALCIASGLSLDETIRCLEILKEGVLYPKDKRDSIIIYSINHKLSLNETNDLLFSKKEATLNK